MILSNVDDVADRDLILEQDEEASDDVLDEGLAAKTDRETDDPTLCTAGMLPLNATTQPSNAPARAMRQIAADRNWWSAHAGTHYRELAHWLRRRGQVSASVFPARIAGSRAAPRAGEKTPLFVRFSTVAGNKGSADLARDVRWHPID